MYLDGKIIVDNWHGGTSISLPVDLVKGVPLEMRMEYFQTSTLGNPSVLLQWSQLSTTSGPNVNSASSIATAAKNAANAGAAIVCVGGANNDGADGTTEGEGVDRSSLALAGNQLALVTAVTEACSQTGTPVIVVLVDGKPTAEPSIKALPTVIASFQGGQSAGDALARILVGKESPSGKLPITFPVSSQVLPVYYNRKPSASRGGYCDISTSVLWQFGHGLSYAKFNYSALTVAPNVEKDGHLRVSFTLKNIGNVTATEVAQMYVRRTSAAAVTTPVRQLKGFKRVMLRSGASAVVSFDPVDVAEELAILNRKYQWEVQPGSWQVFVGGASDDTPLSTTVHVI